MRTFCYTHCAQLFATLLTSVYRLEAQLRNHCILLPPGLCESVHAWHTCFRVMMSTGVAIWIQGLKGRYVAYDMTQQVYTQLCALKNALGMQTVWRVWFRCHHSTSWSQNPPTRLENHGKMVRTLSCIAYSLHPGNQPGTDMPDKSVKELLITTLLP